MLYTGPEISDWTVKHPRTTHEPQTLSGDVGRIPRQKDDMFRDFGVAPFSTVEDHAVEDYGDP